MTNYSSTEFADKVVSKFLYGMESPPVDRATESVIRAKNISTAIDVDARDFMSMSGPGRFARASLSKLVQAFFSFSPNSVWFDANQDGVIDPDASPKILSKEEFLDLLPNNGSDAQGNPIKSYGLNIYQTDFDDGVGDYATRCFLWNSGSFKVSDDAKFVFFPDGRREIWGMAIEPIPNTENFDFVGGNFFADITNLYSSAVIDPFEIGRSVSINFTHIPLIPRKLVYSASDFSADNVALSGAVLDPLLGAARILLEGKELFHGFYDRGTVSYQQDGYDLYYGTNDTDNINTSGPEIPVAQRREYMPEAPKGAWIIGSDSSDILHGDWFSDNLLEGGDGADKLTGGLGDDELHGGDDNDDLYGGEGDDSLSGDDGRDYIKGGGGDDSISGGAGNDVIDAGSDADTLSGDDGDDSIDGGEGDDIIGGDEGDDVIDGGSDDDIISGGSGADRILGAEGADQIDGDEGNDILVGGADADALYGREGNDILDGAQQDGNADDLFGGSGNDIFLTNNGDTIHDIDRGDRVVLDGRLLVGGETKRPPRNPCQPSPDDDADESNVYKGADGTRYTLNGSTLLVSGPGLGSTITILNYRNGDAGIRLKEARPNQTQAECQRDPLILDLNNDHEVVRELFDSSAYFDLDNDGFAERVAWTLAGDGFLAVDRNGNGLIDNGTELFGSGWSEVSGGRNSLKGAAGFAELAAFDTNADGVVSALDANFSSLRVWIDENADGVTDAGELRTLADLGLTSISLTQRRSDDIDCGCDGTEVTYMSTATRADGSSTGVYDAFLALDQYDTIERHGLEITESIRELPQILGSGILSDLDVAMARDPALEEMVRAFVNLPASSAGEIYGRVEAILLRWTGADAIAPDSRGPNMNARWLAAIEKISGSAFNQAAIGPNPRGDAAALLTIEWQKRVALIASQLLGQSALGQTLTPGLSLAAGAFYSAADGTSMASVVASAASHAPSNVAAAMSYWHVMLATLSQYGEELGLTDAQIDALVAPYLDTADIPFSAADIRRAIVGGEASGFLSGTAYSSLVSSTGNDILIATAGVQLLDGLSGNDTYVVGENSGHFTISDTSGRDTLFLAEFNRDDVELAFEPIGGATWIKISGASGAFSLTLALDINNHSISTAIETIRFADGTQIALVDLLQSSSIATTDGLLVLGRAAAGSQLEGGAGNDMLVGFGSSDSYAFGPGGGQDIIQDRAVGASTDRLIIDALPADVTFFTSGDAAGADVIVRIAGGDAELRITGQRSGTDNEIEVIEFSDGSTLTRAQLDARLNTGTADSDVIKGSAGADEIDGLGGDDVLRGGRGIDTYIFGPGSGRDRIDDTSIGNTVQLGAGLDFSDLDFERSGRDGRDLRITIRGTQDSLVVSGGVFNASMTAVRQADGQTLSIFSILQGMGSGLATDVTGTDGNDTLAGTVADERLFGYEGDDVLQGGGGADHYYFSGGTDQIIGNPNGFDILVAPAGARVDSLRIGAYFEISFDGFDGRVFVGNDFVYPGSPDTNTGDDIEGILFDDGTIFDLTQSAVTVGTAGNDVLYSNIMENTLFTPGAGNDFILSGSENDTVVLGAGFGHDILADQEGRSDTVLFEDLNLTASSLSFEREKYDLVVSVIGTDDALTIKDYFLNYAYDEDYFYYGYNNGAVEYFRFANGTDLDHLDVIAAISQPTSGNDWIMTGIRDGGAGNDILVGSDEAETYIFKQGNGHDVVQEEGISSLTTDAVEFQGIALADVMFGRSPLDSASLVITLKATGETVTIDGSINRGIYYSDYLDRARLSIETFVFDDVTLTGGEVASLLFASESTDGDDTIVGFRSNGTIDAGQGNDFIRIVGGGETIVIRPDSGDDIVQFDAHAPSTQFRFEGIAPEDIVFVPVSMVNGVAGQHLRIETGAGASVTILHGLDSRFYPPAEGGWDQPFSLQFGEDSYGFLGETGPLVWWEPIGTDGNDDLIGYEDSTAIDPGAGDDRIFASGGTVIFGRGYGQDRIFNRWAPITPDDPDSRPRFAIELTEDLAPGDITLGWDAQTAGLVRLSIVGTQDFLLFDPRMLDTISFADGTMLELDGNEVIVTPPEPGSQPLPSQEVRGNPGDVLTGAAAYNDFVSVAGGVIVEFGAGSTFDSFYDEAFSVAETEEELPPNWTANSVRLTGVSSVQDLLFVRNGNDLEIYLRDGGDRLTIANQFLLTNGIVSAFILDGGTVLNASDIAALVAFTYPEDLTHQMIEGESGDVVEALPGVETLVSSGGDVTFSVAPNTGQEYIADYVPTSNGEPLDPSWLPNRVVFSGVAGPEDLNFRRDGDHLIIINGNTGDTIQINGQYRVSQGIVGQFDFDGGLTMSWSQIADLVTPFGGNPETIVFPSLSAEPSNGAEQVMLRRGEVVDTLGGDDKIVSLDGNATLIYGVGDGNDRFAAVQPRLQIGSGGDYAGDIVRLEGIATAAELRFLRGGDGLRDLIVELRATGERLVIENQFWAAVEGLPGNLNLETLPVVTTFVLDNNIMLDWADVYRRVEGVDIDGDNDVSSGAEGGLLDGGAGNDSLQGGVGDDLYRFDRAYAEDAIRDIGGSDTVEFGDGVTLSDLFFSRTGPNGEHLLIEVNGTDRLALRIENQFASDATRVEFFQFSDGALYGWADIQQFILRRQATSQDDAVAGFRTSDQIAALAGNDAIIGGSGDDRIDGGTGRDVAIYSGVRTDYEITISNGVTTVRDLIAARDGTDRLTNVEELRFLNEPAGNANLQLVAPNSAPVVTPFSVAGVEDALLSIPLATLLANASDADGDTLRITGLDDVVGGQAWIGLDNQIRFRPNPNFNGSASFTYEVADPNGGITVGTVAIAFAAINDAPTITAQAASGVQDTPITGTVSGTDIDGDALTYAVAANGAHGTVTIDAGTGAYLYMPDAGFFGEDSFTITATDPSGAAAPVTIGVTVAQGSATNHSPVAQSATATGQEEGAVVTGTLTAIDPDQGDAVSFALDAPVAGLSLAANGAWTFDPGHNAYDHLAAGEAFDVVASYHASDQHGASSTSTLRITVTGTNDVPVVGSPLSDGIIPTDTNFSFNLPPNAFSDPDGDTLTYTATLADGGPLPPWLTFNNGTFSGTTPAIADGPFQIKVSASDGTASTFDIFEITVAANSGEPQLDNPLADASVLRGHAVDIVIPPDAFSDGNGDPLAYSATLADGSALPAWLTLVNGHLVGTVPATSLGQFDIRITASDGSSSANDVFRLKIGVETGPEIAAADWELVTNGNDRIVGNGAANSGIYGQGGDDYITADGWNVNVEGGDGNDVIELFGDNNGGIGGAGTDYFIFDGYAFQQWELWSDRWATVEDFQDGVDKIGIMNGSGGVYDFADLQPFMTQSGDDVVISLNGLLPITIANTSLASLDANDFIFTPWDSYGGFGAAPAAGIVPYPVTTNTITVSDWDLVSNANDRILGDGDAGVTLHAMAGHDYITADGGNLTIFAERGNDVIELFSVGNYVEGGHGYDYFVFDATSLVFESWTEIWAIIGDYHDGVDKIVMQNGPGGAENFAALSALMSQDGDDVRITFAEMPDIVIEDTALASLDASDFIFTTSGTTGGALMQSQEVSSRQLISTTSSLSADNIRSSMPWRSQSFTTSHWSPTWQDSFTRRLETMREALSQDFEGGQDRFGGKLRDPRRLGETDDFLLDRRVAIMRQDLSIFGVAQGELTDGLYPADTRSSPVHFAAIT